MCVYTLLKKDGGRLEGKVSKGGKMFSLLIMVRSEERKELREYPFIYNTQKK